MVSYEMELRTLIKKLGLASNVLLVGFRKDILEILGAADIYIQPSILPDSCPRAVLDAMAAGKPVIGTDQGGIPELIEDGKTGIVVKNISPETLAEAILELVREPKKAKEMGLSGKERVKIFFNSEIYVSEISRIYNTVIKHKKSA
jgi:glycosyltransferase involved in cell wall biosynthesis